MLLTQLPRSVKIVVIVGVTLLFVLVLHVLDERPLQLPDFKSTEDADNPSSPAGNEFGHGESSPGPSNSGLETLLCQTLPGAEDILVVMRTGASEIKDKLPVSSLACCLESLGLMC